MAATAHVCGRGNQLDVPGDGGWWLPQQMRRSTPDRTVVGVKQLARLEGSSSQIITGPPITRLGRRVIYVVIFETAHGPYKPYSIVAFTGRKRLVRRTNKNTILSYRWTSLC